MTKAERCMKMRAAKERKRLDAPRAEELEVGFVFLCGPVFGGCHVVRLNAVCDGRRTLDVRIDGRMYAPRTERGLRALIARRIAGKCVA